jgi:Asp-tRNA(Asn)/Glu-tRNA(Gln) amidotransferase B subunit
MKYRSEITSETETTILGKTFVQMTDDGPWEFLSNYYQSKTDLWFSGKPQQILSRIGIETTGARADEFSDLLDGDLGGFYYVAAASDGTDEALKWIMGALAAELNARSLPFSKASQVLPADYLHTFVSYLKEGKFEKSFAKEIFAELIRAERFTDKEASWEVWVAGYGSVPLVYPESRYISGWEHMERICADPRYKASDASEIDSFIEAVIAANPDQVAKLAEKPSLIQYFVGQVMKAAKGKAPAPVVLSKLKERLGIV